jgi:hypothetical protein
MMCMKNRHRYREKRDTALWEDQWDKERTRPKYLSLTFGVSCLQMFL